MIITVASSKGGVGKTTTAVQLAAYLQSLAPTVLLDDDATRSATHWAERAAGRKTPFPFRVAPSIAAAKLAREYTHTIMDTGQQPTLEDLRAAADHSDLLIIPAVPSALDTDGLRQTTDLLKTIHDARFRVLLTRVAPDAAKEATTLRGILAFNGVACFQSEIPRLKAFEKAAGIGQLVGDVDDRNARRAWKCYTDAGKEFCDGHC